MKFAKVLIGILWITVTGLNAYSQEAIDRKIIITTQEWKPYNFDVGSGQAGGIATDVIKRVLDEMDVKYEITIYPWARAQKMVKEGEADAFYSASRNTERDMYAVLSDTIVYQKCVWCVSKESNFEPSELGFAENAKVAALFGSNMLKQLQDKKYSKISSPNSMDSIVKMLDAKRIDAALVNYIVLLECLKTNKINPDNYKIIIYEDSPLGIYFSKKFLDENKWFLSRFNEILKKYKILDNK